MNKLSRLLLIALLALPGVSWANQVLREDTATQIALGPFLDGTDGVTAETALTVTEWDCDLVKHADSGMATTALTITASLGSNDAVHVVSGIYSLELTATDTNTAGRLTIICDHATPATFMPVRQTYMVQPTQEYDSLYGTDVLQVHLVETTAGVITAATIATDAIGGAELAADAGTEIGTATWATTTRTVTAATNITSTGGTTVPQTGDSFARLGAPAGASQAADIAAVKADTAATLVDTADMQPKFGTFTDFGSGTSTLAANLQDLADDGTATYSRATDSLQAIRDQGDSAWITGGGGACTADVGCIADGTAQGVTATTIQLASAETFADTELQCATVVIASASTGAGQARQIDSYVGSTDTATVPTWTTTPTGTITYRVFATPCGSTSNPAPANMVQVSGDSAAADNLEAASDGTGYNLGNGSIVAASVTGAVGSVTGNVGGNVVGSVASVTGAVGSVTGNVGGNVTGSVGSVTGAVGSVTGNVGGTVNGLTSTAQGNVRTAVGLASANLDTQLDALPTAAENATEHLSQQRVLTGTCDSGSTTTCVDDALTQANESQLDDRLICFSDSWCALITGFTPGTDTVTTTKAAPSTRASLGYTIFPATAQ